MDVWSDAIFQLPKARPLNRKSATIVPPHILSFSALDCNHPPPTTPEPSVRSHVSFPLEPLPSASAWRFCSDGPSIIRSPPTDDPLSPSSHSGVHPRSQETETQKKSCDRSYHDLIFPHWKSRGL
ncbi:hypothetical protein MJO28_012498 [Puccinia striiformis f. sp. tritici]|uniref:Uncharacterized protein n=1 Tax=Puccinia striiformis f. sp. tritici TaxID=168172 RepID=A0ACC0E0N3_9BASI|nr:hypothetical protein MJO28_012498 [Puccinia striiformis f. sp. tritici]